MATNYERAFQQRPAVYAAWGQLNGAIKAGMDLRRYELATLAAARRLRVPEPAISERRFESNWMRCMHASKIFERMLSSPIAPLALSTF